MKLKSLLIGSAAALVAVSGARAADVVVADPEPVEYVRVCDAYGAGYFYIPGTQTCMKIGGYVRSEIAGGDNVYATTREERKRDTYAWRTRATLNFSTATDTEYGALRTFIQLRSQWDGGAEYGEAGDSASGQVRFAYIELGGLRVGMDESIFHHWTGAYGNVINDDILTPHSSGRTNVISYTYNAGNGFSAIIGVEQGTDGDDSYGYRSYSYGPYRTNFTPALTKGRVLDQQIDDYAPNVLAGVKFVQGWGGVSLVGAYDAYYSEWAAKLRLDLNVTDKLSLWVMGGYKSGNDYYVASGYDAKKDSLLVKRQFSTMYGEWGGDWAVWGGGTYAFTPATSFNFQVSYDDAKTFAATANVKHEIVRGLTITPELTYVQWNDSFGQKAKYDAFGNLEQIGVRTSLKGKDAFQGMVRLQRSF